MTIQEKSFVAMLVDRLGDAEFLVRVQAGVLLSDMGRQAISALPALRALLTGENASDRRLAVWTLGALGREVADAIPLLRQATCDADEAVHRLAAEALQQIDAVESRGLAA